MPDAMEQKMIDDQEPMTADRFALSICIPTFNKAFVLQKTLESIVREKSFGEGKVEVVVSDNVSTDETPEMLRMYSEKYPGRFRFYRQPAPIDPHFNFEYALNMGTGTFLKLLGYKSPFCPGSLDRLVRAVEQYAELGSFFVTDWQPSRKEEYDLITSVEELVKIVSYPITSINLFCIRRDVFHSLDEPFRAWKINFPHVDIVYRLLDRGEKVLRLNRIQMLYEVLPYHSDRNEARIFGQNYVSLLHDQYTEGHLSRRTYQREKCRTLYRHIIPVHFDFFHQYRIDKKPLPFRQPMMKYYRYDWFFYLAFPWIAFYWFTSNVIPIHQMLGKIKRFLLKKKSPAVPAGDPGQ